MTSFTLLIQLLVVLICTIKVLSLASKNVLIVQNKGGGHGEIGFSLSKQLLQSNHKVTILQDSAYKNTQEPFSSYSSLTTYGAINIIPCKLKSIDDIKSFLGSKTAPFDVIIDNHSKDTETVKTFLDDAPNAQYCYISSGGMYKGKCPSNGHVEATCEVKADNECRIIEQFLIDSGKIYTSFRPQYIYGDNTNKRGNLDWFFDRLAKTTTKSEVTIPIPGDGSQKVALTHVDDVSSMIVAAVGNEKAYKQVFNCGTDSFIGYKEICESIAKLAGGKKINYVSYDPKKLETKPSFPFRPSTFTLDPSQAKAVLGWSAKKSIAADLEKWYSQYKALGLAEKAFDDAEDKSIIVSV